ncbi:putative phage tail protein [Bacillus horti]|uniref:DUF2313 domain-containing protein n=1 Tax=Caldalkalibacillus horti TaxID=77523 RepID=A0ABT9W062_9BACI|nr:putative phage tail protein [Bacillus horti]MDQ0166645.1 hypothetical protein [Bacillus horti]
MRATKTGVSNSNKRLMGYLPEFYHDIVDFVQLTDTQEAEIISSKQAIQLLFDNQFVMSSDERAVRRRERMLGIQADPTRETLDFRKKRIVNRYSTKPPFTMRYLQDRLDFLVGAGRAITSVDPEAFVLKVTVDIENADIFKEVEHTIKTIKPANIVYQQETALWDSIELKEHITRRTITRQTRLSTSWQLGRTPFATASEEVVVK